MPKNCYLFNVPKAKRLKVCLNCGALFLSQRVEIGRYCSYACEKGQRARLGPPNPSKLWSRVRISDSGCWEWTGHINHLGYGQIHFMDGIKYAHRVAYELVFGRIPSGLLVCHKCDNGRCCNPQHLFLGTATDNNRDTIAKGRGARAVGSKVGGAKLTEWAVRMIRAGHRIGELPSALARQFSVSASSITQIVQRKTWKHIQ
jgi:hypothetical protein